MAFYKHWFKKEKRTRIEIEDRNKKQAEGLRLLYEIFKEITGNHEELIDKFVQGFETPDKEVLNFVEKYQLHFIENEAPLARYKRAEQFVRLRVK